ncbi:HAD-superfamily hydrolase [Ascodesmis nigricans]|uniref:HAD-superfamily hydrolase n=1 Tax=Ascodesmis nigricans TaxID=341454 RepID=A0A4S2N3T7_9PEZI|nr:HAD-superfamily hydrolase [Ascodesmis nigricans]
MSVRLLRPTTLPLHHPSSLLPILSIRCLQHSSTTPPAKPSHKPFAFAFDIDGVLLHGSTPIPGASQTLHTLNRLSIPYLLLTNGGGLSESKRVSDLSTLLSTNLSVSQFVQSHTPFQLLRSSHSTILVVGGTRDNCRQVARDYGFENVLIPGDIFASHPGVAPFSNIDIYKDFVLPSAGSEKDGVKGTKVDAVFVFNDPRDWALDIQVIVDVLLSEDGVLGTRRRPEVVKKLGHVPVYFSNPDLWWANEYEHPRLGQGGFRAALEGVWNAIAGENLKAETIGKPHPKTYEYAEDVLIRWAGGEGGKGGLERVYMVGDNPASDVAGANGFISKRGVEWISCLVKTGVYRPGDDDGNAKMVVENVKEAVGTVLKREGMDQS